MLEGVPTVTSAATDSGLRAATTRGELAAAAVADERDRVVEPFERALHLAGFDLAAPDREPGRRELRIELACKWCIQLWGQAEPTDE